MWKKEKIFIDLESLWTLKSSLWGLFEKSLEAPEIEVNFCNYWWWCISVETKDCDSSNEIDLSAIRLCTMQCFYSSNESNYYPKKDKIRFVIYRNAHCKANVEQSSSVCYPKLKVSNINSVIEFRQRVIAPPIHLDIEQTQFIKPQK